MEALEGLEAGLVRGADVEAIAFERPSGIGMMEIAPRVGAMRGLEAAAASDEFSMGRVHLNVN